MKADCTRGRDSPGIYECVEISQEMSFHLRAGTKLGNSQHEAPKVVPKVSVLNRDVENLNQLKLPASMCILRQKPNHIQCMHVKAGIETLGSRQTCHESREKLPS